MFRGKQVVITEKLDGENSSIYADGSYHARSVDSVAHPSRTRMSALAANIRTVGIPKGWKIVGENVYAKHSIYYNQLPDYFLVFGIIDENNISLSWDKVVEWCELLDLKTVPVIASFVWTQNFVDSAFWTSLYPTKSLYSTHNDAEGYVVRLAGEYSMDALGSSLSKFVRQGHVQAYYHWMNSELVFNSLASVKTSVC